MRLLITSHEAHKEKRGGVEGVAAARAEKIRWSEGSGDVTLVANKSFSSSFIRGFVQQHQERAVRSTRQWKQKMLRYICRKFN